MTVTEDIGLALKAKLFRGFADTSRLAILEALRSGEKTVSELITLVRLSQSNTSMHLACLKDCGLVQSRQEGRRVYYALADARMESILRTVEDLLADVAAKVYVCTRYQGRGAQDENDS